MIRYSQLLVSKLIDIDEKSSFGEITNVVFSKKYDGVKGLVIKNDRLSKAKYFLPFKNISSIDKDIIFIEFKNDLSKYLLKDENLVDKEEPFIEWEIVSENMECIGYVKDIVIKKSDGKILGFIISEGLIEDLVKGRNFLPFLKDNKIINKSVVVKEENKKYISKNNYYYKKLIELENEDRGKLNI